MAKAAFIRQYSKSLLVMTWGNLFTKVNLVRPPLVQSALAQNFLSDKLLEWLLSDIENDTDRLLLAASRSYEKSLLSQTQNMLEKQPPPIKQAQPPSNHSHSFTAPKTEEGIHNTRAKGVPSKTVEDTKYCIHLWNEWKRYCQETLGDSIPDLNKKSRS